MKIQFDIEQSQLELFGGVLLSIMVSNETNAEDYLNALNNMKRIYDLMNDDQRHTMKVIRNNFELNADKINERVNKFQEKFSDEFSDLFTDEEELL